MPKGKELSAEEKAKREAAKAEKFVELAQKRMGKALDAIGALAGLANKGNYSYTQEQVTKMADALGAEATRVFSKFATDAKPEAEGKFSF